jgi:hypothetical protein
VQVPSCCSGAPSQAIERDVIGWGFGVINMTSGNIIIAEVKCGYDSLEIKVQIREGSLLKRLSNI